MKWQVQRQMVEIFEVEDAPDAHTAIGLVKSGKVVSQGPPKEIFGANSAERIATRQMRHVGVETKHPIYDPKLLKWPMVLMPMKLLAKPDDLGLGDIIERVVGPVGGEAYKAWHLTTFGVPCGCNYRKDYLNKRYPLRKP